jgi:predicted phage terminase large subunit-like protein
MGACFSPKLETIKKVQGTSIFSRQYLNEPVSDEDADFKRESFIHLPWEQVKLIPINWYLLCDPSYSDPRGNSNWSDFAAFVIAGMDYQRKLYVRYVKRAKMTYGEIINELFRIYTDTQFKDLKMTKVLLEVIGTKSLSYELSNEMKQRNTYLPITEIRHQSKSKEERIRALAPFYEFGNVIHVKECPQLEELELELIQFPAGRHDDVADCFSSVLTVASPANTKKAEYSDQPSKKRLMSYKPRSPITGV